MPTNFDNQINKIFNRYVSWLFIVFLLAIAWHYNYHEILFKRPQSVHSWRQCDCASITLNYYQNRMNFFQPQVHNLTSDNNTTGKCATSEAPLLYYTVAVLYHVFGAHEFIYRLLVMMIFFWGLFSLFKLFQYNLNDNFWAVLLGLLFFTSPVLIFYGNSFISNIPAFAFVLAAWRYFFRYKLKNHKRDFYWAFVFFAIAGLLKITALLSFFALFILFLAEWILDFKISDKKPFFRRYKKTIFLFFGVLLIVAAWVGYAKYYNQKHDCHYFSTTVFPLWEQDMEGIRDILKDVYHHWLHQYFNRYTLLFIGLAALFVIVFIKNAKRFLLFLTVLAGFGFLSYISLQFWTLQDHDYYTINLFILPVFIVLLFFDVLKSRFPALFLSWIIKILAFFFLLFNIQHAKFQLDKRYNETGLRMHVYHHIDNYLDSLGVSNSDTVICMPEYSNVPLYLMNRKGWTNYVDGVTNPSENHHNRDSVVIKKMIEKGAKYLLISDKKDLYADFLQPYLFDKKGKYKNVNVFRIDKQPDSAYLAQLGQEKIIKEVICGLENIANNKSYYVTKNSAVNIKTNGIRTQERVHNGNYAVKLTNKKAFGLTTSIKNVQTGDHFKISVWRWSPNGDGVLVAAANNKKEFYETVHNGNVKDEKGWILLKMDIYIPESLPGNELIIYTWNNGKLPVFFDDFSIQQFRRER